MLIIETKIGAKNRSWHADKKKPFYFGESIPDCTAVIWYQEGQWVLSVYKDGITLRGDPRSPDVYLLYANDVIGFDGSTFTVESL